MFAGLFKGILDGKNHLTILKLNLILKPHGNLIVKLLNILQIIGKKFNSANNEKIGDRY